MVEQEAKDSGPNEKSWSFAQFVDLSQFFKSGIHRLKR